MWREYNSCRRQREYRLQQYHSYDESSAYLWDKIAEDSFTPESMATMLTEEYDIDNATALEDASTLAKQWMEAGIIED